MRLKITLILFFFLILFYSFNSMAVDCKKPQMPSLKEWESWLIDIRNEAKKEGISEKTINQELKFILPQKKNYFKRSLST